MGIVKQQEGKLKKKNSHIYFYTVYTGDAAINALNGKPIYQNIIFM